MISKRSGKTAVQQPSDATRNQTILSKLHQRIVIALRGEYNILSGWRFPVFNEDGTPVCFSDAQDNQNAELDTQGAGWLEEQFHDAEL